MLWTILKCVGLVFKFLPTIIFRLFWRAADVLDGRVGAVVRYMLICRRLGGCGDRVYLGPNIVIDHPRLVFLGNGVSIHHGVTLLSGGQIFIGENVAIAHGVSIVSGNHTWTDPSIPIKFNSVDLSPVTIHEDVWVGCGVRILAGVNIGSRTVVAAGAVVTKSLDSHGIYVGVPAKRVKAIE